MNANWLRAVDRFLNRHQWGAPLVVLVLMLFIYSGTRSAVDGISYLQKQRLAAALITCEEGNLARVANIGNLRSDRHNLRAELNLYQAIAALSTPESKAASPPNLSQLFARDIRTKEETIAHKTLAIHQSIAAHRHFAIRRGSPIENCPEAVGAS